MTRFLLGLAVGYLVATHPAWVDVALRAVMTQLGG